MSKEDVPWKEFISVGILIFFIVVIINISINIITCSTGNEYLKQMRIETYKMELKE